jgi:CHAT domain-containing protein
MNTSHQPLIVAAWLSVIFAVSLAAQDPLLPGKPLERTIADGQPHTYRITLQAGQFVQFAVQQTSCDVALTVLAPDGKKIGEADTTMYGLPETLSVIAATMGEYQLTVQIGRLIKVQGKYQLRATLHDTPTEQDKQRITAERLMFDLSKAPNTQQRMDNAQQALTLWRGLGERYWEAYLLSRISFIHSNELQQNDKAIEITEQALTIVRALKDRTSEAILTANLGWFQYTQRKYEKSRAHYETALAIYRSIQHKPGEIELLSRLINLSTSLGELEKAQEYFQQALPLTVETGSRFAEYQLRRGMATGFNAKGRYLEALPHLDIALTIARELKEQAWEASALDALGFVAYFGKNDLPQAIASHEQALAIYRQLKMRSAELFQLARLGFIYREDAQEDVARNYYESALAIVRELKDAREAMVLNQLGQIYHRMYGTDKAIETYEQMLTASRLYKQKNWEADALTNLGTAYLYGKQNLEKGMQFLEQSLAVSKEANYYIGHTFNLQQLSESYRLLGEYEKAVGLMNESIVVATKVGPGAKQFEVFAWYSLGQLYFFLGQHEKALEATHTGIKLAEAIVVENRRPTEGGYMLLGMLHQSKKQFDQAREAHEKMLTIFQKWNDQQAIASAYELLASDYVGLEQYERALEYLDQAKLIRNSPKYIGNGAQLEAQYGDVRFGQKNYAQAIAHHQRALFLYRQKLLGKPYEAPYYEQLMKDWKASGEATMAIYFGKQAVNSYQDIRASLQNLEKDLQQSFLKSKEQTYRELADLLISQGRLPEAEQVIRMLKEEEFYEYIRRDNKNAPKSEKASLTPEEAALDKRYREIADNLTAIGSERSALLEKQTRTPEENQRLTKLEADLSVAAQKFQRFLDGLATEMTKSKDAIVRYSQVSDAQGLQSDLRELGKGVAALYTIVGEDKYSVILTTADVQKAYQTPIKAADLNRKILAFRAVLQNPKLDPLPLAQELYKILLAPVAKDLRAMKAETLMWSLDGVLRYVPMTALHDGEKYLVERFRHSVFTPVSNARLKDTPSRHWQALGLGVTKSFGANIPALPGVAEEMRGIIKAAGSQTGVLPGTIKLDEQFTQEAMLTSLREQKPVVHIASHFQFKPGNETASALLLGDGQFLSLATIKSLANPFSGVELLTLSACDTATGGIGANGNEIEGFGALAQKKGAKAVIASLWPVADRSTKTLMQEFYRRREARADLPKVEALRQAQIQLMQGELVTTVELTQREIVHETKATANAPAYKVDPKKPYAHPYYWAPFILIGNWK